MLFHAAPPSTDPVPAQWLEALGKNGRHMAQSMLAFCPQARPTPLIALPVLAAKLGIGSLQIKDEGHRLGLGSFKALGGAYAVLRLVLGRAAAALGYQVQPSEIVSPAVRAIAARLTVACATDGNHGRSVAAGARIAGCRCVIFVHAGVSAARLEPIRAQGADIRVGAGTYDDCVREARETAEREGWIIVADTAWEGYEDIPLTVMQGYTVMAGEAFDVLDQPPTHLFLQAGVGGMAGAAAAHAQAVYADRSPMIIIVEPERAACLMASAKAGMAQSIAHDQPTLMAMLECYTPSSLAWEILRSLAQGYMALREEEAVMAMRRLAYPEPGDPAIIAGESGCAGFAGLLAALQDRPTRQALRLDHTARVLIFNSEGASDPALYERWVGQKPEQILQVSRATHQPGATA
jgi:diaminopropionate ammonia-lyase